MDGKTDGQVIPMLTGVIICQHAELIFYFCFVLVALCPKSTAMVMAGRSVHLTTLLNKRLTINSCTYFRLTPTTALLE